MIPSIEFIRDLTEYSIVMKEAIVLSKTNKNIISFKNILDRINEKIDQKANDGENEYVLLFSLNKNIKDKEVAEKLFDNKMKRVEILSKIFKRFGYETEMFVKKNQPSLKIFW